MLLVYLEPLVLAQVTILTSWDRQVRYWPRSYAHTEQYNAAIPTDWWLLFTQESLAAQWLMMYPEQTRIVRTLFD
jgi:hypothetical protein